MMDQKPEKKTSMSRLVAALICALCVDACLFYARVSVVPPHGVGARLAVLWLFAVLRCAALTAVPLLCLGRVRPLLVRVAAAHSLLPAVLESGTAALRRGAEEPPPQPEDARSWLLCAAASAAAALFWEVTVADTGEDRAADGDPEKQKARILFLRVLRLFRPDSLKLFGGVVFLTLAVLCEMSVPFYTGRVIDLLSGQEQQQQDQFTTALLFMGLFSLGSAVSSGCRGGLLLCAVSAFTCRIKVRLFGALAKQEIGFFEVTKTGVMTQRLSNDTSRMGMSVCLNVNVLLRTLVKTLGCVALMSSLSWKLTLLLLLLEAPVTVAVQTVYNTHYQRLTLQMQDSMASANEAAKEVVSNVRVVRSFNAGTHEARRYGDNLMDTHDLKTRRGAVRAVFLLAVRLAGLCVKVVMLIYGRRLIQSGHMTPGSLLSFMLYQADIASCISTLAHSFGDMLNSVAAAGKVFEYTDRKPEVVTDGKLKPDDVTGRVSFRGLSFAYPRNPDKMVLQDFSLDLKPGKLTALVGPSGGGKTTCVSLLERYYEPQTGQILLDDEPLEAYDHAFLHQKVAVVSQDPVLFSGSIRDNIAYGLPQCSLPQIQEAAASANAHHFIQQLEKGYDTEVGEGGGQLSKSEKQRIAIARALVRRPRVLILDEITSSLDADSENEVQQALTGRLDQTLLVIAHKLTTIEKADQIVVVGGGRVEERGTHRELMEMRGCYYRLVEKVFAE